VGSWRFHPTTGGKTQRRRTPSGVAASKQGDATSARLGAQATPIEELAALGGAQATAIVEVASSFDADLMFSAPLAESTET